MERQYKGDKERRDRQEDWQRETERNTARMRKTHTQEDRQIETEKKTERTRKIQAGI